MKGIGGHERPIRGRSNDWLTPPEILHALGPFDLDPCTPEEMPWPTATRRFTPTSNGLSQPWSGRVWMNPPYGPETIAWLKRLADHGNGIALVFARTETAMFFRYVWPRADAILFLKGRVRFHRLDGTIGGQPGAPSCLIAYGKRNARRLARAKIEGRFLSLTANPLTL
jgi:hypothetical protein